MRGLVIRVVLGLGDGAGDGEEGGVRGGGRGGTQRHGWLSKDNEVISYLFCLSQGLPMPGLSELQLPYYLRNLSSFSLLSSFVQNTKRQY